MHTNNMLLSMLHDRRYIEMVVNADGGGTWHDPSTLDITAQIADKVNHTVRTAFAASGMP